MDGTHIQRLRISCKALWEVRLKCSEIKILKKIKSKSPNIELTYDDVQSWRHWVDDAHRGKTHAVRGACRWDDRAERAASRVWLSIKRTDICKRSSSSPAGMMPMCSGQGCKTTSGSFSQWPASCCVRPTTPWSTSLNMPSPPTHTTLSLEQREASLVFPSPSPPVLANGAERPHPSKPARSFFRRWSLAWLARSVTTQSNISSDSTCQTFNTKVSITLTNHVRADSSQLEQRGHQRMVDLSAFPFASEWVDEHQESLWAQWTWKETLRSWNTWKGLNTVNSFFA